MSPGARTGRALGNVIGLVPIVFFCFFFLFSLFVVVLVVVAIVQKNSGRRCG